MATQNITGKVRLRRDSAQNWTISNPILGSGEVGIETDTLRAKIGDGSTVWNNLPYCYLALTGDTMTGSISWEHGAVGYKPTAHTSIDPCRQLMVTAGGVDEAWDSPNAKIALHIYDSTETNSAENGAFVLQASDGTNYPSLQGKPNGDLTWNGKNLNHCADLSTFASASSFTKPTIIQSRVKDLGGGYKKVGNIVYVYVRFRMNTSLSKGGWGVLENFPSPHNMGFSADYRIPLIATAWYGDPYSGNVSSAFMDSNGIIRLIFNATMDASSTSNYYIHIYGYYYSS